MTDAAPFGIHLIASGRTAWQEQGRLQGDADLPLSEAGRIELSRLATETALPPVRLVHCGPDEASHDTAELFAAGLGAKVKPVTALAEMQLGLWQGLQTSEVADRYPRAYGQWKHEPTSVSIPEGETLQHAADRIRKAVTRLAERADGDALVLVLRPIVLGLCALWLSDRPIADWRPAMDFAPVQQFDVDADRLGVKRSRRRRARTRSMAT